MAHFFRTWVDFFRREARSSSPFLWSGEIESLPKLPACDSIRYYFFHFKLLAFTLTSPIVQGIGYCINHFTQLKKVLWLQYHNLCVTLIAKKSLVLTLLGVFVFFGCECASPDNVYALSKSKDFGYDKSSYCKNNTFSILWNGCSMNHCLE